LIYQKDEPSSFKKVYTLFEEFGSRYAAALPEICAFMSAYVAGESGVILRAPTAAEGVTLVQVHVAAPEPGGTFNVVVPTLAKEPVANRSRVYCIGGNVCVGVTDGVCVGDNDGVGVCVFVGV
jgi:hypothetical protein